MASACASEGARVEPSDLNLRDLLGLAPEQAMHWDVDDRAEARRLLLSPQASPDQDHLVTLGWGRSKQEWVLASVAAFDCERAALRQPLVAFATAAIERETLHLRSHATPHLDTEGSHADIELYLEGWEGGEAEGWEDLPQHRLAFVQRLARMASPAVDSISIRPAPQEPFAALYLQPSETSASGRPAPQEAPGILLINPVLLAAIDPDPETHGERLQSRALESPSKGKGAAVLGKSAPGSSAPGSSASPVFSSANPYSFYGSVAECAAAERLRCEDCLPNSSCVQSSRDAASGEAECEALAEADGRGYFLYCANLSLAIETVAFCASEDVPQCQAVTSASNQILLLDANTRFLDDAICRAGLDICLTELYGEPDDDYPPVPLDGGPGPMPPRPRQTDVSCGDQNCDFSPQCESSCGSASCGESLSCGGDSGGGSDSSGGGCGGCGGSGGCGGGDSCGGSDCTSCKSESDDDAGGGCGGESESESGDSCGSGGSCGGCGSCGSGESESSGCSSCYTAEQRGRARWSLAITVLWALFPLFLMSGWLRNERARPLTEEDSP